MALIMQVADPLTLFRQPENMFVAGFIGSPPMNLIKGKIQKREGGLVFVETADSNPLTLPLSGRYRSSCGPNTSTKRSYLGVRPEQIGNEPKIRWLHDAGYFEVSRSPSQWVRSRLYT